MQHPTYFNWSSKPSGRPMTSAAASGIGLSQHQHSQVPRSFSSSQSPGPSYQHQQSQQIGASQSIIHMRRSSAPQRVSLLRDIDIAGERDKDPGIPTKASDQIVPDLHGKILTS